MYSVWLNGLSKCHSCTTVILIVITGSNITAYILKYIVMQQGQTYMRALLSTFHVLSLPIIHNNTYHQVILDPLVLRGDLFPAVVCVVEILRREG